MAKTDCHDDTVVVTSPSNSVISGQPTTQMAVTVSVFCQSTQCLLPSICLLNILFVYNEEVCVCVHACVPVCVCMCVCVYHVCVCVCERERDQVTHVWIHILQLHNIPHLALITVCVCVCVCYIKSDIDMNFCN